MPAARRRVVRRRCDHPAAHRLYRPIPNRREPSHRTRSSHDHGDSLPRHRPAADRLIEVLVRDGDPTRPGPPVDVAARRERRPGCESIRMPPGDPSRRPAIARHPIPAEARPKSPAAIMEAGPAPGDARIERPTVRGVDPLSVGVRLPVGRDVRGHPDAAVVRRVHPTAVRRKRLIEGLLRRLLRGRREGCGILVALRRWLFLERRRRRRDLVGGRFHVVLCAGREA